MKLYTYLEKHPTVTSTDHNHKLHKSVLEELMETKFWKDYRRECILNTGRDLDHKEVVKELVRDLQIEPGDPPTPKTTFRVEVIIWEITAYNGDNDPDNTDQDMVYEADVKEFATYEEAEEFAKWVRLRSEVNKQAD